jgi:hypothetical protein
MKGDDLDPKGLIVESYRMDGIGMAECRSIFIDWALSMPGETADGSALRALLDRYGDAHPDHPMTQVLKEGLARPAEPGRRGGRRQRRPQA